MTIDGYAISTLMIWARNQAPVVRWNEGVNQNTAEAERRLVRLEIAAELTENLPPNDSAFPREHVVARVYLAEPRCRPDIDHEWYKQHYPCECGPLAERKVD
jgi:hypothetical protein